MSLRRILLSVLTLALASQGIHAGSETGADFLKIPIGAREVALGQTSAALSQGTNALNWNPAGIAQIPRSVGHPTGGFSFSHQELFLGTNLDQVGVIMTPRALSRPFTWGFSVVRLAHPDQDGRAADRSETGSFKANDLAVGSALAMRVGSLKLGTHIKYIRQSLAEFQAQGVAVDLGFQSPTPMNRLSIGGAVRNLGPKMQFVQEEFNLPLTLSVGAAYRLMAPLTLGLDMTSRPHEGNFSVALGTEYQAMQVLLLQQLILGNYQLR